MAVASLFLAWFVLIAADYNENSQLAFGVPGVLGSSDPQESDPLVRDTLYGKVRGKMRALHFLGGKQVERYLGIPYASPPVGELRFEVPAPPKPWKGVRDARSVPKACPQANWDLRYVRRHEPSFKKSQMDEDCLYLNVYVPAATPQRKEEEERGRPVLIHVHGGSNEVGMGAMFHGDVLASLADIIVITFNYRLWLFGFLSGQNPDLPGNYGLHDQTEAFRWVSKNIHFFGGDPSKVTIQGHSAGGGDVGHHILSPLSKDLFRYVVMMSGSPMAFWAIQRGPDPPVASIQQFADSLGCGKAPDILSCLKNKAWQDVLSAPVPYREGMFELLPVVDGHFILESPGKGLTQLPLNGKAFMTGVTSDEGSRSAQRAQQVARSMRRPFSFEEDFTDQYDVLPFGEVAHEVPNFGRLVYHEYKSWQDPHNVTADLLSVTHIVGDPTFVAPAVKVAQLLSARDDSVYFYSFDHVSRLSKDPQWMGVPHGRDLFYLFGCPISSHPLHRYTELDMNVSRAVIDLWSNFVRYGRPFRSSEPDRVLPTFEQRNQSYFVITSDGRDVRINTARRLRARQVAFWNDLLPELRKPAPDRDRMYITLTWVFVGLTSALLVVVVLLTICVLYFKKVARERCVVHATDEKNSCQV